MFHLLLYLLLPGAKNEHEERAAASRLRQRARVAYDERAATIDEVERSD